MVYQFGSHSFLLGARRHESALASLTDISHQCSYRSSFIHAQECLHVPMGHNGLLKLWALSKPDLSQTYDVILVDEAQDACGAIIGVVRQRQSDRPPKPTKGPLPQTRRRAHTRRFISRVTCVVMLSSPPRGPPPVRLVRGRLAGSSSLLLDHLASPSPSSQYHRRSQHRSHLRLDLPSALELFGVAKLNGFVNLTGLD